MYFYDDLKTEFEAYERAPIESDIRKYASLLKAFEDMLTRKRHKAIRAEYLGALNNTNQPTPSLTVKIADAPGNKPKAKAKATPTKEPPTAALPVTPTAATRASTPTNKAPCFDFVAGK